MKVKVKRARRLQGIQNLRKARKRGKTQTLHSITQYYTELVCTAFYYGWFDVYCLHKFSKYIPYKLSIEKQRSIVDG